MSTTVAEPDVDQVVDAIEHLDFTPALPCESRIHPIAHVPAEVATWHLVIAACPHAGGCVPASELLICESGYTRLRSHGLIRCASCTCMAEPTYWIRSATRIDVGSQR